MSWSDQGTSGPILFVAYFVLYGLEYFFPLVKKKSEHYRANLSMTLLLIIVNLAFTSLTFAVAHWVKVNEVGLFNNVQAHKVIAVIISVIILDLWTGYVAHVLFHRYDFLWRLHVIHHSDDHVDVTTTFRQHPVESIIRVFFNISGLVILGIPAWVLLIYLTLSTLHAQFEHANIKLPNKLDHLLQFVFVTPNMHKIHHSKYQTETDSNYSNIFSVWDRIFRTYNKRKDYSTIEYGLDFLNGRERFDLWTLVKMPFKRRQGKSNG
jgi:sterol desaturase/sphingolipid hydroxylase (fatty acid hydroxylase superfamily)